MQFLVGVWLLPLAKHPFSGYSNTQHLTPYFCSFTGNALLRFIEDIMTQEAHIGGNSKVDVIKARVIAAFLRARDILTEKSIWETLKAEPTSIKNIYINYVVILAAVSPLAQFINQVFSGYSVIPSLLFNIVSYAVSLLGLFVVSWIALKLAPTFGGSTDHTNTFKWFAYSMTAFYAASIFILVPYIGWILTLLGLFSLFQLYVNTTLFTGVSEAKKIPYLAVTLVASFIAWLIIGAVVFAIVGVLGISQVRHLQNPGFDLRNYQGSAQ